MSLYILFATILINKNQLHFSSFDFFLIQYFNIYFCCAYIFRKPVMQIIDRGFQLSAKDREMLGKDGHELQV
jgi:hypothetical protein